MASKILFLLVFLNPMVFSKELKIGAFNPQILGQSKVKSPFSLTYLTKITARYDILLLQEIRDKTQGPESAPQKFLEYLKSETGTPWKMALSERVGGGQTSVEQYAYYYRSDKVELVKSYLIPKTISHIARTPFVAHFKPKGSSFDFALIGVHTDPDLAKKEVLNLGDAFKYVSKIKREEDTVILGDFNASCDYINMDALSSPYLTIKDRGNGEKAFIKDPSIFEWLISNDTKTNTANINCAYDRIITSGSLKKKVVPNSAQVFYFDKAYNLTREETRKVSDHYPVELKIKVEGGRQIRPDFISHCQSPKSAKEDPAKKTFWALKKLLEAANCIDLYEMLPDYAWIDLREMDVTDLNPLKEFKDLSVVI